MTTARETDDGNSRFPNLIRTNREGYPRNYLFREFLMREIPGDVLTAEAKMLS